MIPVKLYLRNFMSYGDEGTEVDFDFHIACLSGSNGDGKSALLDAITWALWGMARGVAGSGAGSEDLIHADGQADEALVEFTFRLGEALYRVTRRRHRKRGGGVALEAWDGERGAFRPLTSATQRETQGMISRLLRMEYETFINSAFLLQGRADEFTRRRPTERKEVLAEILDLGQYDELAQRARDEGRAAKARAGQLGAEIERMSEEAGREADCQANVQRLEQAVAQTQEELAAAEARAEQARGKVTALEAEASRLSDLEANLKRVTQDQERLARQVETFRTRVAASRAMVERKEEIAAGAAELARLREEEAALAGKAQQAAALGRERDAAAARIEAEGTRLEDLIAQKKREASAKAAEAGKAERLAEELAGAQEALSAAEEAGRQIEALREAAQAAQSSRAAAQAGGEQAKQAAEETSRKAGLLEGAEARCPVCRQALKTEDREQVLQHLAQEKQRAAAAQREAANEIAATAKELNEIQRRVQPLRRQAEGAAALAQRVGGLQGQVERARQAAGEAKALAEEAEGLAGRLQAGEFAQEQRRALADAEAKVAAVRYDAARHEAVRGRLAEAGRFEREQALLEQAEASLASDERTLAEIEGSAEEKRRSREYLTKEIGNIRISVSGLDEARREAAQAAQSVVERRKAHTEATAQAGVWRERLERCRALAREVVARRKQRRQAERDGEAYGALSQAFGRNGIQALIIENVVPQLAEYANELLERLSDGRMRVGFVTQKTTSKGEAAETLEIVISEGESSRKYELYSGGEAFRADFAIRVALSRLLAHRAGASLKTLVVDEGFGTQDTQGRQRLVEAILAIRDQFERILVVTHIEDLKDAFPHRIEVTKDDRGSHVRQMAVA